jgi:hypothetical protein
MSVSTNSEDSVMQEDRLSDLLTCIVSRVRRINYVQPDGSRNASEGPIEFTLDDGGAVLRLESGADGESLRFRTGEWVDPFAEPLSPENREFVARSGKWTAFDVSADEDYRGVIGQHVKNLNLMSRNGKVIGIELQFASMTIRAEVAADDLIVDLRSEHGQ